MIKETRTIHYDAELAIEAYWLQNVLEPFPDHFHDYYLIGFIEKGARELTCGGQKYITTEGDLFTLNPHEPHGCRSYDGKPFSYRGIGVLPDVMRAAMREITGQAILPRFRERILSQANGVFCGRRHDRSGKTRSSGGRNLSMLQGSFC
ncbi:MAG: AraC family ligand binding domain-containing protein [Bilophila wadsworthia]